jgi:hypothetical protein
MGWAATGVDPLQALANVRYWAVQFRESLRSTLRSSTTRNRGAPSLCTYLPSALELNMLTSSPPRPSVRGEQISIIHGSGRTIGMLSWPSCEKTNVISDWSAQ